MPDAEFAATLGGLFEGSPWVARQLCTRRPFRSLAKLLENLRDIVWRAPVVRQLALLRAHPELGAAGGKDGMSAASLREQRAAGLDRDDVVPRGQLAALNRAYRERFGFPFIIAVRAVSVVGIPAALEQRLANSAAAELRAALSEACRIAEFRLGDLLSGSRQPPGQPRFHVRGARPRR